MTAQDVIARGEAIDIPSEIFHFQPFLVMTVLFAWMVILATTLFIRSAVDGNRSTSPLGHIVSILGLIAGGASTALLIAGYLNVENTYIEATAEWKTEAAYPYIKSNEHIDLELTSIEKAPYAGKDQPDEIIKYRNAEQIIEQLDSPEETRYDDTDGKKSYRLIYDVPTGEKPFVRFYMLGEDLGHGMKAGAYGLDVHLNEKQ